MKPYEYDVYRNTQQMLQSILGDGVAKVYEQDGYTTTFIIDSLGGLLASTIYEIIDATEYPTEDLDKELVLMFLNRYQDVFSSLNGESDKIEIEYLFDEENKNVN